MTTPTKAAIAALALTVIVLAAVLLSHQGQRHQRALTIRAVERTLPEQMNRTPAVKDAGLTVERATCVRRSDTEARCIADARSEAGPAEPVPVRVQIDNDTGAMIWETESE